MSRLKTFPEKNLKFILRRMINEIGPYDSEIISYTSRKILKEIFDDIALSVDEDDIQFIFALYELNPNFETDRIKIPELHSYEVITKRVATVTIEEYYSNKVDSYFDNPEDLESYIGWFGGAADWWEGNLIDREERDEETVETETERIKKIR